MSFHTPSFAAHSTAQEPTGRTTVKTELSRLGDDSDTKIKYMLTCIPLYLFRCIPKIDFTSQYSLHFGVQLLSSLFLKTKTNKLYIGIFYCLSHISSKLICYTFLRHLVGSPKTRLRAPYNFRSKRRFRRTLRNVEALCKFNSHIKVKIRVR